MTPSEASRLPLCAFAGSVLCLTFVASAEHAAAESGYDLWLRYRTSDASTRSVVREPATALLVSGTSPASEVVRRELARGLRGLLGAEIPVSDAVRADGTLVVATRASSPALVAELGLVPALARLGREGYLIRSARIGRPRRDRDRLGGRGRRALRRVPFPAPDPDAASRSQRSTSPSGRGSSAACSNHWDNLDGSIERGYAGRLALAGPSCPAASTRGSWTTRARTPRSASTAPSSTASTRTRSR